MSEEKNLGMHGKPRLFLWNYTDEEKAKVEQFLAEVKAPPAVLIQQDQGYLPLRDIIHADKRGEEVFECDEKLVLFYNIPSKAIGFLIDQSKQRHLPRPIYAAVTEESINWSFNKLMEDLIHERDAFRKLAQQAQQASG